MNQKVLLLVTVAEVPFWKADWVCSLTCAGSAGSNSFTCSLADSVTNKRSGMPRHVPHSVLQTYTFIIQEAFCFFNLLLIIHSHQNPSYISFLTNILWDHSRVDTLQHPFIDKATQCLYHSKEMLTNSRAGNNKPPKRRKRFYKALEENQKGTVTPGVTQIYLGRSHEGLNPDCL